MEISKAYNVCCNDCGVEGIEINEDFDAEINVIELSDQDVYLCEECLKVLCLKINEFLKDK
ncbi:MAG: hypothetical protein RR942_06020 [Romboutsia sp.]